MNNLASCEVCHAFDTAKFPNQEKYESGSFPDSKPEYRIKVYYQDVKSQAAQGCFTCKVLLEAILFAWDSEYEPLVIIGFFSEGNPSFFQVSSYEDYGSGWKTTFWLFSRKDQPAPWRTVGGISTNSVFDVLSGDRLNILKGWLDDCTANHTSCRPNERRRVPKRLLDIGEPSADGSKLILVEAVDENTPYVALSHCWRFSIPNPERINLTQANLAERKHSILQDQLSPTFLNAISITRALGLRYIWIDSLCIIQDSPDDWAEQASQLADIYENAEFTVAAEFVEGGAQDDGCFLLRKDVKEIVIDEGATNTVSSVFIRREYGHSKLKGGGLATRGWCVQEKLLSRRLIRFRPSDIFFECASGIRCECLALGINLAEAGNHSDSVDKWNPTAGIMCRHDRDQPGPDGKGTGGDQDWEQSIHAAWRTAVRASSRTALTFETDRLPAMSGMASRMPHDIFGVYLAGLWGSYLPDELLWSPEDDGQAPRRSTESGSYSYIAPSFSWASLPGVSIDWPGQDPRNWWHIQRAPERVDADPSAFIRKAVVLEVKNVPSTIDPLGKVTWKEGEGGGFIRLRTRIAAIRKGVYEGRPRSRFNQQRDPYRFDTAEDAEDHWYDRSNVSVVEISFDEKLTRALLVVPSSRESGAFERVGTVFFDNLDFFDQAIVSDVRII